MSAIYYLRAEGFEANAWLKILEMDDDEDEREFSKSIVYDFFTQAEGTFQKMDKSLQVPLPLALTLFLTPRQFVNQ